MKIVYCLFEDSHLFEKLRYFKNKRFSVKNTFNSYDEVCVAQYRKHMQKRVRENKKNNIGSCVVVRGNGFLAQQPFYSYGHPLSQTNHAERQRFYSPSAATDSSVLTSIVTFLVSLALLFSTLESKFNLRSTKLGRLKFLLLNLIGVACSLVKSL